MQKHILYSILSAAVIGILAIVINDSSIAYAASDNSAMLDMALDIGKSDKFNNNMHDFLTGMMTVARALSSIMICLGAIMYATNMESGMKIIWQGVLGLGLVLNAGAFIYTGFGGYIPQDSVVTQEALKFQVDVSDTPDFTGVFSGPNSFPSMYEKYTKLGAAAMLAPAAKLLLVLTTINVVIKVSLDLINGDKIRYMTEVVLETGAYLWLILNWYGDNGIDMMGSLMSGFESLGYQAAGQSTSGVDGLQANDILGNAATIMSLAFTNAFSFNPITSICSMVFIFVIFFLLVLTGIEMFMARIEFWTLAMLTIPLIGFAALPQTRFLFTSALNCMMNLAIKVCVIAFLTVMSTGILTNYVEAFKQKAADGDLVGNFPLFIQAVLVSFLLYLMVRKIPDLISSLLSGRPSLGGASMTQIAKSAANTAVKAGAAAATGGSSLAKSALSGAAQGYAGSNGSKFKAAGAAMAGGLNRAAGSMMSGAAGVGKAMLIGSPGNSGGYGGYGGSGGLLGGMYQSAKSGAEIGSSFANGKNATTMISDSTRNAKYQLTTYEKQMPAYDKKTGKSIYEKDVDGNVVMGKDGKPVQAMMPTGRHGGLLGNIADIKNDFTRKPEK